MSAYHRSIFLINRPFQIRFAMYVVSWILGLSFVYPLIIYKLFGYYLHYVRLDPMGPAFSSLETTRTEILWLLCAFQIIFVVLTFLMSIFISHRIAGPVYKLSKFIEGAQKGNLTEQLYFRQKDHFKELAGDYNGLIRSIRGRLERKNEAIASIVPHIERALEHADPEGKTQLEAALKALRVGLE